VALAGGIIAWHRLSGGFRMAFERLSGISIILILLELGWRASHGRIFRPLDGSGSDGEDFDAAVFSVSIMSDLTVAQIVRKSWRMEGLKWH
jgi:hypothetical protein